MCVQFFFVIERTRDLIYLKFVATDLAPVLAKTPVIQRSPCYSAVAALLTPPTSLRINTSLSLFGPDPLLSRSPGDYNNFTAAAHFTSESSRELRRNAVP